MNRFISVVLCAGMLGVVGPAWTAEYYLSAKGAGAKNGRSWDDSFAFSSINDVLNSTMKSSDTLHLEGGAYGRVQIIIASSGEAGALKTIIGEDRGKGLPLFGPATNGEWMNWEQHGLLLKAKSSHWIIKNLQFQLYAEPTVCTEGEHTDLVFDNLRVLRAYTGFKFVDCHDTVVRNCYATRYSREGFLFVKHCDHMTMQNCEADGSQGDIADPNASQIGFQCGQSKSAGADGNAYMTFENCVARNNLEGDRKQSWVQGDGFVAELADRHLTFRRCRSFNASDGCYDLKAQIDEFTDCVAVGPGRCFKLWAQTMAMKNCIAILTAGGRFRSTGVPCALEVNNRLKRVALDGHITAQSCTFCIRGGAPGFWGESGKATLNDSIVSFASSEADNAAAKPGPDDVVLKYERTAIHKNASDSDSPKFLNPSPDWDGMGTNYDSQTHGTSKGYHSSRVGKLP